MIKHLEFVKRFETEEKDNEDVSYICTFKIKNYIMEIFLSDYGQCYFVKYKNIDTGEVEECGLGTYNEYILEDAIGIIDPKGVFISLDGKEAWDEITQTLVDRWVQRGWKDETPENFEWMLRTRNREDYDTYDFESMYKDLENYGR